MGLEISVRGHLIDEVDSVDGRVYPVNLPEQPELPALTYQMISNNKQYTHSGDAGVSEKRVQVNIWSENYGEAKEISEEVIKAMSGFYGYMLDTAVGKSHMANAQDEYSPDTGLYQIITEFINGYYDN